MAAESGSASSQTEPAESPVAKGDAPNTNREKEGKGDPVAYYVQYEDTRYGPFFDLEQATPLTESPHRIIPLYTHPSPVPVQLTNEEINRLCDEEYPMPPVPMITGFCIETVAYASQLNQRIAYSKGLRFLRDRMKGE